jgi:hypothetical protein
MVTLRIIILMATSMTSSFEINQTDPFLHHER